MYSQLSNLFAGMAVIFVVLIAYFIASLIANYMLLGKIGRKKWPGLIPYVNDYCLIHFGIIKYLQHGLLCTY